MRPSLFWMVVGLALGGCATVRPAPKSGVVDSPSGGPKGYQHGADRSRFAFGGGGRAVEELGFIKRVGAEGTLAVLASNGTVLGIPNADASSLKVPPFGDTPEAHDAEVRRYFVQSGIPEEQIRNVRTATLLEATGGGDERSKVTPKVTAYYSILERAVGETPVPDSFAWARINAKGEVVAEGVYWPALPASVLADAQRLRQVLQDQDGHRSRLPWTLGDREVVIRHASAMYGGEFAAFASIDVRLRLLPSTVTTPAPKGQAMTVVRHFDENGNELFLPQEKRTLEPKDLPSP
jgi:hypothetical protein